MSETNEILEDGTFRLDQPVELPDVLDVLIVGGGPAGTAAAFHAQELGLSALVIDYDDLMKRIRDYAKDKQILPDFGGGDRMQFPLGGDLIAALHFDPIEKDDMCAAWKSMYRRFNIAAKIGLELTRLEPREGLTWQAFAWNHHTQSEESFAAKHVVLALGRGVPRRFDIAGNTDGIAFRLTDPALYVGDPAIVIGGGTSAAEAVIAISNQKVKASDATAIYWGYRGDKMPKVSKALASVFFDAYVGNGNIRYLPKSEPVSVVTAEDGKEYLCIRTDRKIMPGRPAETLHLEFLKKVCIACIGEEIPEGLLNTLGIALVTGGSKNKKRIVVTPLHETCQPNVYLIGDILSPVHHSTESFDSDPATFQDVKRRGNVKAALRDGVFVTEVIAQKLAGKTEVHVQLSFADAETPKKPREAAGVAAAPTPLAAPQARLVRLLKGGVEAEEYPVSSDDVTTIGRYGCDVNFPDDALVSDKHASIVHGKDGFSLRDEESRNGLFVQAAEGKNVPVGGGTIVKVGNQWLVFGSGQFPDSLTHYDARGKKMGGYALEEKTVVLGREAPDITLDAADKTLSRRHVAISRKGGVVSIRDLKSINGTFVKVNQARALEDGDQILLGAQTMWFSTHESARPRNDVSMSISRPPLTLPPPSAPSPEPGPAPAADAGPTVTFDNLGKTFPIKPGQTICELAEEMGVKIRAECHRGLCGSDPIRVVSGRDNLHPISDEEELTLDDICGVEPGEHRLACLARITGPVTVEILD